MMGKGHYDEYVAAFLANQQAVADLDPVDDADALEAAGDRLNEAEAALKAARDEAIEAAALLADDGDLAVALKLAEDALADQTSIVEGVRSEISSLAPVKLLSEDSANPGHAIFSAVAAGKGTTEAVIDGVSSNYGRTQVNATDIETNAADITTNSTSIANNRVDIDTNAANIATNTTNIATNRADIDTNTAGIATNAGNIATNTGNIATNTTNITTNTANIASNRTDINSNTAGITANSGRIDANAAGITQLNSDVDLLRSGIASALAVAGMPMTPGSGWGASIGTGYFDGESAIAAGLVYKGDRYNFKFAVGNSGGETSASAGVSMGFK